MSTAEILAQLPQLDEQSRAAIRAKLDQLNGQATDVTCAAIAAHPAVGIWKDRTDLPDDAVAASQVLRDRLMRPSDA